MPSLKHDARHSGHPSPDRICMVTMADARARAKYDLSLRSQVCYARRHGYIVGVMDILPFSEAEQRKYGRNLPTTYRKHDILETWSRDERCEWLVWFDGDMFIVDAQRPLTAFLPTHSKNVSVVMKDDPNALNNGAFMLRNTPWLQDALLPLWRDLDFKSAGYPFTDNGSMLELLLRLFVPGYRPFECGAPGGSMVIASFLTCVNRKLYPVFGDSCLHPTDCTQFPGRSANGLLL